MSSLEVRLLGGFQVRWNGREIDEFESQKVRALFAYLACWPGRSFSRDQLSDLLWPHQRSDSARRNLRQALYNLRRVIVREAGEEFDPLETARQSVRFRTEPWIWLDIDAFQAKLRGRQREDGSFDSSALSEVVQLYKGDFLAGFFVKDCINFETWMLQEQEQLREAVVSALQSLIEHHSNEGSFALGVRYSRQLLHIDPLSEEAHRRLMRLYAISGRRGRAIEVYQSLCHLLRSELGVEPLAETKAEYASIVEEALPDPEMKSKVELVGPAVPMVGRDATIAALRKTWSLVREGKGFLTLVEGEHGVGKTRLMRSFIDEATRQGDATVLHGRCYDILVPPFLGVFADALGNAFDHEVDLSQDLLSNLTKEHLAALGGMVPGILQLAPELEALLAESPPSMELLTLSISRFLEVLCQPTSNTRSLRPVIIFLDDVHWSDPSSREILSLLGEFTLDLPVWLVVTLQEGVCAAADVAESANHWEASRWQALSLERLEEPEINEIAQSLAGQNHVEPIRQALIKCDGLPLTITELLNLLWDCGLLVNSQNAEGLFLKQSQQEGDPAISSPVQGIDSLDEITRERVSRLPTSTRRLLSLAAVAGYDFDSDLLQKAEQEHEVVVETGLRILVDHRVIRHVLGYWADSRRQRDIALWASGTGKATFEFTHAKIRTAMYDGLHPARRQVLHRQLASVLENRLAGGDPRARFPLIYQYLRAGDWSRAIDHLEQAAELAALAGAISTAEAYRVQAQECGCNLEQSLAEA